MKRVFPFYLAVSIAAATLLIAVAADAAPTPKKGIPQPQRYAELLAKARAGTLRIQSLGDSPD